MESHALKPFLSGPKQEAEGSNFPPVLDACCGSRMFWFEREDSRALFMDRREDIYIVDRGTAGTKGRKPVIVAPQIKADFTEMPFPDQSFWHVVFDPPHYTAKSMTGNSKLAHSYGMLIAGWEEMLAGGFKECFRVLKPFGTLIFKWCSTEISLERVLALAGQRPLYGHRSGKKATTFWVAFIKHTGAVAPAAQKRTTLDVASPQADNRGSSQGIQPDSVRSHDWLEGGAANLTENGNATHADSRDTKQSQAPPSNASNSATPARP